MDEKTVVVVLVIVLAGGAIFYFATRPAKPAAKSGGSGNAVLGAACTALGLPASACTALAPLAGDITDTGVKVGKDALSVVTTASSEGAGTVNTFIKAGGGAVRDTAGYFAEGGKAYLKYGTGVGQAAFVYKEGAKVVEGGVDLTKKTVSAAGRAVEDAASGAAKVAGKVWDTISFW